MNRTRDADAPRGTGRRPAARGFTLLELLIVTAILGVVVATVGACIAAGIRVWEEARVFSALESRSLLGLEILERDLRNTFVFYGIPFSGEDRDLSFPGLMSVPSADAESGRDLPGVVIGRVGYTLESAGGELVRTVSPYASLEGVDAVQETVIEGVDRLSFTYVEGGERVRSWSSSTNLPDRVDIRLFLEEGEDRLEIERTVLLPVTNSYVIQS